MTGERRSGELALAGEQAVEARLSPAEAHRVLRQRLQRLTGAWGLSPSDPHHLARQVHARTYAAGEILVRRGIRADCLGLVIRGQVAVNVGEGGAARVVVVLLPGSTFGEAMLNRGEPSNATLQALTDCEIRFLRRADLQALSIQRRVERQAGALWQLVRVSGFVLAVMLVAVLALSLPSSRKALAVLPMGIGQWCSQRNLETCAGRAWQVAANLTPTDPNPLLALGAHHFKLGEVAAAEQAFEKARDLEPESPEAYNNLGLIYAQQGQHEKAIPAFEKALELEPGIATIEHNLAASLQANQQYAEAVEHYQTALALGEPEANTLVNMAIAYYEAGQRAQAVEAAQQALAYYGALAPVYTILGAAALEGREPEKAIVDLQKAIALDSSYGQAHFYLGLAYKSMSRPREAIAAFEEALARASDEVTRVRIRRHLNELYEENRAP